MRTAKILRKTGETDISLELNLDGSGVSTIDTGCGFLDHMLTLFAKHGRFDLTLTCKGDTWVDDHHTVEDVGIALGQAFTQAIGDKKGICRYGNMILPMDETLILSAVDISGRAFYQSELSMRAKKVAFISSATAMARRLRSSFTALGSWPGILSAGVPGRRE